LDDLSVLEKIFLWAVFTITPFFITPMYGRNYLSRVDSSDDSNDNLTSVIGT